MPINDVLISHLYRRVVTAIQKRQQLLGPVCAVLAVMVALQLVSLYADWQDARLFPAMQHYLRQRLMNAILDMHSEDYDELGIGGIIAKLSKLPTVVYNYLDQWKFTITPCIATMLVGICYFAYHDWQLAAALAVPVAAVLAVVFHKNDDCLPPAKMRDMEFNKLHDEVDDVLLNMMAVYSCGSRELEEQRLAAIQDLYSQYTRDTTVCTIRFRAAVVVLQMAFVAFFMWRCYRLLQANKLSAGTYVSLFFIVLYMNGAVTRCCAQIRDLAMRKGVIDETLAIYDRGSLTAAAATAAAGTAPGIPASAVISLRGVVFTYRGAARPLLDGLDLDIMRGDRVLLTGRIGSGKSTVLKVIMRFHRQQAGEVYLMGAPYSELPAGEVRRHIAYVPQYPILFNRTILENIVYGLSAVEVTEQDVWALIDRVGLRDMFAAFPSGLHTPVGKRGQHISGGQRQVVWLLRVLLLDPDVLLLDEPTASIDADTKKHVEKLLRMTMEGRTVLMVSHDTHLAGTANRRIVIDRGRIVSDARLQEEVGWGGAPH